MMRNKMRVPGRKSDDEPGDAHFLTFSCYHRLPFLEPEKHKQIFIENLGRSRDRLGFLLYAYVVMPEHVHLLLWPGEGGATIAQILQSVKQPVSARLRYRIGMPPAYWQAGGGHDRNVWSSKTVLSIIEYIHNNPVERGLSRTPLDYPWSSAAWYEDRTGPLVVDPWCP
ncbi:MAG: transposase [Armatimonadetes bacterium]|nr:transposase [Armatimonadota bacterium]